VRLQHFDCARHIAAPQSALQAAQQLRFDRLAAADSATQLQAFLLQVMPVEYQCLVRQRSQSVREQASNPARAISNQQQATECSYTQEHGDMHMLEERGGHATQLAIAMLGHDPRRAQRRK
jgi:hypothetical protein